MNLFKKYILFIWVVIGLSIAANAQFYRGYDHEFGKSRIQYQDFNWASYDFDKYSVYFYANGRQNAEYTAQLAPIVIADLERRFDYYLDEKIQFIVYNKFSDYKQSNAGISDDDQDDVGGITRIVDSKVFLYFNGNHEHLEQQIRAGVAHILVNRLMLGKNWKEVLRNSALLTIPDWYIEGLVSYLKDPWSTEIADKIKDGVITNDFKQFNRLRDEDATLAGHAIWKYIATTYGEKVIPNILYMSRLSRNVESGFLYVIGLSLKSLNRESINYYTEYFKLNGVKGEEVAEKVKLKKTKGQIQDAKISPDGNFIAYSTNVTGKYNVWLYDIKEEKTTKIFKHGYKLNWSYNKDYPVLAWKPNSSSIAIFYDDKAHLMVSHFDVETKKSFSKPVMKLDNILSATYTPDGKRIMMSASIKGQTDIYEYNPTSNSQRKLTNDYFDDINPVVYQDKIVFSSNRTDDTLRINPKAEPIANKFDLFYMSRYGKAEVLDRITNTEDSQEFSPIVLDSASIGFVTDNGEQSYVMSASFDSVISRIDTAIHYKSIAVTSIHAKYKLNILGHSYSDTKTNRGINVFYGGGNKYVSFTSQNGLSVDNLGSTTPSILVPATNRKLLNYKLIPKVENYSLEVDYNNYQFEGEEPITPSPEEGLAPVVTAAKPADSLAQDSTKVEEKPRFILPKQKDYKLAFSSLDLQTQLNFNYATAMYQVYTGLPFMNTRAGLEASVKLVDMFNNHELKGGVRASVDLRTKEYFLTYKNREKRLNKMVGIERSSSEFLVGFQKFKLTYDNLWAQFKYPFSEVFCLRATTSLRYDRLAELSTEQRSLATPTQGNLVQGIKAELVFDNTQALELNILKGTRAKLFAETYNGVINTMVGITEDSSVVTNIFSANPDIIILGLDLRNYTQVHREIIWANRLAASTSIGEQKLLYYMGGVDNKIHLSEKSRFDLNTPVSPDQNYYYQAMATNIRGFLQNTRNGNNFVLFNSELRIPVFKYFASKPLKSDFIKNFQTVLFTDVGTAWTGTNPFSDENYFNTTVIEDGNVKIILRNQDNPIIGSYGFGLRSRLMGYFMKLDFAWAVEDGRVAKRPKAYLSVGLDF